MQERDEQVRDRIRLTGVTATGYHGVLAHERREGQTFVADVVLHVDTRPAAAEDRLDRTVDYGVLAEQVAGVLGGEPADLLETVAERIAAAALTHPTVAAVEVVLHKPQAPITVPFGDVTVEVHRDRTWRPVVAPPPVEVAPARTTGQHAAPPSVGSPEAGGADGAPVPFAEILAPHLAGAVGVTGAAGATGATGVIGAAATVTAVVAEPTEPTVTDRLDVAPEAPVDVVLSLGSNLGASQDTLRQAIWDLAALDGLELTVISPLARTAPVGGPDQPDYLNAIVLGRSTLSPRGLLRACQEVEVRHGRERDEHWGPRTLDIDIVLHGGTVAVSDDLELPHPRAHQRAFVLQPWAQVDPDAMLPGLGGGPVADLARTAPDRAGIRWMALDWWKQPEVDS